MLASTKTHKLQDGTDYYTINPKGYVPVLELDDGERLTEGPAIVQYIADQVPEKKLAPANGTMARYRLQEWLNFIDQRAAQGPRPAVQPGDARGGQGDDAQGEAWPTATSWVDAQLEGKSYLMGDSFCVADAYLFTVANWAAVGIDISPLKNLGAFMGRMPPGPRCRKR